MAEKKQIPLRISKELFDELSRWAEDDFRSLNGQIEFLLTDAVRKRRRKEFQEADGEKEGPFPYASSSILSMISTTLSEKMSKSLSSF